MEPPFGDAFQNYSFADQALTSTDLLSSSSDPDFMYELDRDMCHRHSPRGDSAAGLAQGGKEAEGYTRLASCDIWGTKEVDFLGLDDFSSPYQDEEVIGRTPTLAQLNSEDSQPVCETLYHPAELLPPAPPLQPLLPPPPGHNKRPSGFGFSPGPPATRPCPAPPSSLSRPYGSPLPDFPEGSQMATWPVASSTETMAKTQRHLTLTQDHVHAQLKTKGSQEGAMAAPSYHGSLFVRKAKVRVSAAHNTQSPDVQGSHVPLPLSQPPEEKASTSGNGGGGLGASGGTVAFCSSRGAREGTGRREMPTASQAGRSAAMPQMDALEAGGDVGVLGGGGGGGSLDAESAEKTKEEEHNYSLDAFSEPGYDMELVEDIKGLTAGVSSRKRGKRRYFWEYSEQLTPSKHERMLKPSEWDRHTLPSNLYQKNGPLHGKYKLKKSRRTDVEDLTPNPRKLLQIGTELRKLNKVISDLTPVSELPLTARPRSRKEKNKLASRACRLKKKAQYEANKVKLWGLSTEYVTRVKNSAPQAANMADTLERLVQETLVSSPVAGQTSDFVNHILENTGHGDPTGGLVGLRVPTSKS
ncbi:hypothetical protein NHX12_010676 [Muraenolepis orangiensis]|uniref:BZIP domain-containing protein n=1 Tax=Muraenolepis orangiensis TaxID=630683 RepID=A0A9Q0DMQ5_9TELE|nr:hypothetical protein NHX12_010676 [Muraenolepis orangiensis]